MTVHSLAPVLAILLPMGGAAVVYFVGRRFPRAAGPLAAAILGLTFCMCVWVAAIVLGGRSAHLAIVAAPNGFLALYVDGLSALMLLLIGL
ncbi:MAG TPA: hypothetical protein VM283_08955, partial [Armatimonadota bacterium]|nr:hypothetical protein [Armatimonadota bacterium]